MATAVFAVAVVVVECRRDGAAGGGGDCGG